jgi:putative glutamine amidotransferase
MKRVYIVGGGYSENGLFKEYGYAITNKIEEADLAVFTGGADINPAIYGDAVHPQTYFHEYRDSKELEAYELLREQQTPMVGICRGGQLLNALAGGGMFQHIDKHAGGRHYMTDLITGEEILVNSIHHQMMKPAPHALVVAAAYLGGNREWMDGQIVKRGKSDEDIEVIVYEKEKYLCFQAHPEYAGSDLQHMKDYFFNLIHKYLGV